MSDPTPTPAVVVVTDDTPSVPKRVRVWAYVTGIVIGVGVGPALAAVGYADLGVAFGALGAAANAIALGNLSKR